MQETPSISNSTRASNLYQIGDNGPDACEVQDWGGSTGDPIANDIHHAFRRVQAFGSTGGAQRPEQIFSQLQNQLKEKNQMPNPNTRRIVQVFIADPNDNVPLDSALLYKGTEQLTEMTDTELFFEVPIAQLLKDHNAKRTTWPDKEASKRAGKDIFLDAIKIRDLKMLVVDVARF